MSVDIPERPEFFKVLRDNGDAPQGVGRWVVGERKEVTGDLVLCQNGLHVVRLEHLLSFLHYGPAIHPVIEASPERVEGSDKVVLRYATIGPRFAAWNHQTVVCFAADCAERVLYIYETAYPDDDRPRKAIEAVRSSSKNAAGAADAAAYAAADAAAADAAYAAARAAGAAGAADAAADAAVNAAAGAAVNAADAAYAAAYAAARAADAADAADAAAYAVNAAAGAAVNAADAADAAYAAARAADAADAADAAAYAVNAAAGAAERSWQHDRLWQYISGQVRIPA